MLKRKMDMKGVVKAVPGIKPLQAKNIVKEPKNNIRIARSTNKLKLPTARVVSEWLGSPDRPWDFTGSVDNNSKRLCKYLQLMFPDHDWATLPSQMCFDVVSLTAGIIIEVKSVQKGTKVITTNSSIYPDKVRAGDVLPANYAHTPKGYNENNILDVLVVCVEKLDGRVYDYAVVDGAYWGFTQEDYVNCRSLFRNMNSADFKAKWMDLYTQEFPEDMFIAKANSGMYGAALKFDLRPRFAISSPVNALDVAGWWNVQA